MHNWPRHMIFVAGLAMLAGCPLAGIGNANSADDESVSGQNDRSEEDGVSRPPDPPLGGGVSDPVDPPPRFQTEPKITSSSKELFSLEYPFVQRVSSTLDLRNRRGETATGVLVESEVSLNLQSDGDLEGDIVTTIPQTIDNAQVQVRARFLTQDRRELFTELAGPYWSSSYRSREGTHYVFKLARNIAGASLVELVIESVDYSAPCPGCPTTNFPPSNPQTPTTHIFILPGMLGNSFRIENVKRLLEASTDADGNPIEVHVWDWTGIWPDQRLSIQDRLYITEQTCKIGKRFAEALRDWRDASTNVHAVHLIGLSAGTMIAKAACGATNGLGSILEDGFFDKILFLSGALDIRESWKSLDDKSNAIFNYYSLADQIVATRFPTFLIFRIRVSVAWPACGGVGLKQGSDAEAGHVSWQLPWVPEERNGRAEDLGNRGGHLNPGCLAEDYFKEYILPIFTKNQDEWPMRSAAIPDGWHPDIHDVYRQDQTGWGLPDRDRPLCP